jgi:hypothetical protein
LMRSLSLSIDVSFCRDVIAGLVPAIPIRQALCFL